MDYNLFGWLTIKISVPLQMSALLVDWLLKQVYLTFKTNVSLQMYALLVDWLLKQVYLYRCLHSSYRGYIMNEAIAIGMHIIQNDTYHNTH